MSESQAPQMTLHGTERSGHVHRVVLLLRMLEIPYRFVSAPAEVRRTPQFQRLNPLGEIPVLEDGATLICDSNAILVYLAKRYAPGSQWLPEEPLAAARVQRWLSIAAGEMTYGPALTRLVVQWGDPGGRAGAIRTADRLFGLLDGDVKGHSFLAADPPTN